MTNKLYADSLYTGHYIPGQPRTHLRVDDGALLTARRRRAPADAAPVRAVLDADELARARALLAGASWGDGARHRPASSRRWPRTTSSCRRTGEAAKALQRIVLAALNRHHLFFSAALPRRILPPLFNRYAGSTNAFGDHVDNAVRFVPGSGERVRSDISCTLFLADPGEYDGGELVIEDTFGGRSVKLPAGDMLLYPGTSVHRVEPVTRGARVASFFWVESMVRSVEQRRLLFDMDGHLMRLRSSIGEADPAVIGLTGTYHNLLAPLGRRVSPRGVPGGVDAPARPIRRFSGARRAAPSRRR